VLSVLSKLLSPFKRHYRFFGEVFLLAISAFGGPSAHLAMMLDRLVEKRKYLTEKELLELMALCQILPGPTSTQTITAIGYRRGGPAVAFITLLIWALPAVTAMTILAIIYNSVKEQGLPAKALAFIQPIAIGFVIYATIKIASKVLDRWGTYVLALAVCILALVFPSPYLFPVLLIGGGIIANFMTQETEEEKSRKYTFKPKIRFLSAFMIVFALSAVLAVLFPLLPVQLFENFYRFGSLVFGGGQVLVPFMLEQFVYFNEYMTSEEFLTGYGFNQGLPGPVFSFASFVGAMCMSDYGTWGQLLGGLIGAIGIFLPGTLLIFFIYPLWNYLKGIPAVRKSLLGINAAAAGLVASAAFLLVKAIEFTPENVIITIITAVILQFTKIPAPVIILIGLIAGIIYSFI